MIWGTFCDRDLFFFIEEKRLLQSTAPESVVQVRNCDLMLSFQVPAQLLKAVH